MKTFVKTMMVMTAGMMVAPAALAQTAAPAPASPAPAAPATGAAASSFSDGDLEKFASAAIEMNKIQADASVAATDKQPKMLAAVQASGLEPAKFNEIAQAAEKDPGLQQKIQAAAAKTAPAPAPAAPPQ